MTDQASSTIESSDSQKTRFSTIRLGESHVQSAPQTRLLPGRVDVIYILKPMYWSSLSAGILALSFAFDSTEWPVSIVISAWFLLFLWCWIYGIAYRHRRIFLKLFASLGTIITGMALSFLCWERAQAQLIWVSDNMIERGTSWLLTSASLVTALIPILCLAHLFYLGRGYREKLNS